jgi:hypothetical protein
MQEQNNKITTQTRRKATSDLITIVVSRENYAKLRDLGKTGDSFNTVISRVLSNLDQGASSNN